MGKDAAAARDETTEIRASWVVAYDGSDHRIIEQGRVVYRGDRIVHVGRHWSGVADRIIDATDKLVIPGLISTHAHVGASYGDRLIVDTGRRDLLRSGFLNYEPRRAAGGPAFTAADDPDASIRFGFGSLLRHGVSTVVEMGGGLFDGGVTMLRRAGECGIRLYYAPGFNPGTYTFDDRGRLHRSTDERGAFAAMDRAAEFIARHAGAYQRRYRGILIPDEAFNCTPKVLQRTRVLADELRVGITLHVGEQVYEFEDAVRRTGRTPVGLLAEHGLLGPDVILGHCRFVGGNSQIAYPYDDDLETVARSGATVAHAPLAGGRRGGVLESFQRYLDRGINMSIGTDTYPLDIVAEMQAAALFCKVTEQRPEVASAGDIFRAATLGGARALGRDDLGRLSRGAKADIAIIDFHALRVGPVYDPIRSLVHAASGELVDTVIVDGRTVVRDGRVLAWNMDSVTQDVRRAGERIWQRFPNYHWSGGPVEAVFPRSLTLWDGLEPTRDLASEVVDATAPQVPRRGRRSGC